MSLGMAKLAMAMAALTATKTMAMRDHNVYSSQLKYIITGNRGVPRRGWPRLRGPDYSDIRPVLKRGKRRTLALKLAQVVNWHDERANLYGCHPCPKCGEVRNRAAIKWRGARIIECAACGDRRPIRDWIG